MRILIVHGRYRSAAPSGENRVVDQEAELLSRAGHRVDLFERHSDDIAGWSPARKATLPVRSVRNAQARRELAERLARDRPDVVHVHNTFPLISASVLQACHDAGVPVVVTLHNYKLLCASGDFFREGRPCHACAEGSLAPALRHGCYRGSRAATLPVVAGIGLNRAWWRSLVSAYIFVSASQRDLMQGLALPAERVFVKHNFVARPGELPGDLPGEPRPEPGDGVPEHRVIYLGRLDEAKGLRFLMRSWDLLRTAAPDSRLRLAIVGGGPLESAVHTWASTHTSVDVLGQVTPDEGARLLSRSLAAVMPSQWEETFGLVAAEAMARSVAPVAPARGSFPDLVTDGVNGVLFAPDDPADLARVLADLDREPARFAEYGRQGRTTWQKRFSPEGNLEELLEVYRFAIDHRQGREER